MGHADEKKEFALRASHLHKSFGAQRAVHDVSIEVEKGEIFGFLGPNGAGKTTTVRMLTGILAPDSGNVELNGLDLDKSRMEAKMGVGVIPEVGNIYVDLTAQQNIELTGRFYGLKKDFIHERSKEILTSLGIYERRNDPVRTFSKGMQQRVSIACAIIHDPALLFMDEPTEGLDVQSRRLITEKVREMNSRGCTIFLTTHNIEEANALCDRVCIINKGAVVALGTPDDLRQAFEKTQSVIAIFDNPIDADSDEEFYALEVKRQGARMVCTTDNPDATVKTLVGFAQQHNVGILSLETVGPSLEDTFVALTEGSK